MKKWLTYAGFHSAAAICFMLVGLTWFAANVVVVGIELTMTAHKVSMR